MPLSLDEIEKIVQEAEALPPGKDKDEILKEADDLLNEYVSKQKEQPYFNPVEKVVAKIGQVLSPVLEPYQKYVAAPIKTAAVKGLEQVTPEGTVPKEIIEAKNPDLKTLFSSPAYGLSEVPLSERPLVKSLFSEKPSEYSKWFTWQKGGPLDVSPAGIAGGTAEAILDPLTWVAPETVGAKIGEAAGAVGKKLLNVGFGVKPETATRYLSRAAQVEKASMEEMKATIDAAQRAIEAERSLAGKTLETTKGKLQSAREEIDAAVKAEKQRIAQEMFDLGEQKRQLSQQMGVEGQAYKTEQQQLAEQAILQKEELLKQQAQDLMTAEMQAKNQLDVAEAQYKQASESPEISNQREAIRAEQERLGMAQEEPAISAVAESEQALETVKQQALAEAKAKAIPPPGVGQQIVESVNNLKNTIDEGSSAAYDVLNQSNKTIDMSKFANQLRSKAENLKVKGKFPTPDVEKSYNALIDQADRLDIGDLSLPDAKGFIQEIDRVAFDTTGAYPGKYQSTMRNIRRSIDQDLKSIAPPEYAKKMAEVSKQRQLFERVQPMFGEEAKAIGAFQSVATPRGAPMAESLKSLGSPELSQAIDEFLKSKEALKTDPGLRQALKGIPEEQALNAAKENLSKIKEFNKARGKGEFSVLSEKQVLAAEAKLKEAQNSYKKLQQINVERTKAVKEATPISEVKARKVEQNYSTKQTEFSDKMAQLEEKMSQLRNPEIKTERLSKAEQEAARAQMEIPKAQEAMDVAESKSEAYKKLTEGSSEAFADQLLRQAYSPDRKLFDKKVAENISKYAGKDVMEMAKDLAAKRNFEAQNLAGSRNTLLYGSAGAAIDPMLGFPGALLGSAIDKYGPKIGKGLLDISRVTTPIAGAAAKGAVRTNLLEQTIFDYLQEQERKKQENQ